MRLVDKQALHLAYNQAAWEIIEQVSWRVRSKIHNQVGFEPDLSEIRWLIQDQVEGLSTT